MYPVIYWVEYWDEIDNTATKVSGCTFSDTLSGAMANIESYYGDTINSIKLELLEERKVLEFVNYKEAEAIVKN